jgi:hypothetical protein
VILLNYFIKIIYGSHLKIPPFPPYPAIILRYSPNYLEGEFSEVRPGTFCTSKIRLGLPLLYATHEVV